MDILPSAEAGDTPVLDIRGLTLAMPATADREFAVEDLSFSIERGKTLCLVGESGSGKSMTAHAVMGLLPPEIVPVRGSVALDGRNVLGLSDKSWLSVRGREIGMIFQEPMTSLNPIMRVGDQIIESFKLHNQLTPRLRKEAAFELLNEVGLPDPKRLASSYPHQLSGGQRQRVMIAMALSLKPKLLIADEPTTALDVSTQAQILRLIRELQSRHGTTVLFITHDFGVVADIADHVGVLQDGRLVESGPASQIFRSPKEGYTKRLLAAVPSLIPPPPKDLSAAPERLALTGLMKRYPGGGFFNKRREVQAANDVSFTLRQGETLGLVGESGSGKSTVGRCITRLIDPDAGDIRLGDTVFSSLGQAALRGERKRIQIVFQDPFASLNPRRTVGQIIAEGPLIQGQTRSAAFQRTRELLELVGLSPQASDRFPHEFSGGQRQRIGIARALALNPEVLVADEPVSALDVSIQAQILALIKEIQQRLGLAILFITHDMRVAAQVCDRIAVMQNGSIVELQQTKDLFASPQHPYTQQLLASIPGKALASDEASSKAAS